MKYFRYLKVSCVTDAIIANAAVGEVQLAVYNAIAEYSRLNNFSCNFKTYSAHSAKHAPTGHTLMPCSYGEILSDSHFQQSDIVFVPLWGLSPVADILSFAPKSAKKVALYFGITRPHLYPEQYENLEEGYKQAIVLNEADMVFVTSDYIAKDVMSFGVAKHKIHIIPLFAEATFPGIVPQRENARKKVQLTFLSRFCSAKGVVHMFDALQQWEDKDWTLNVIYPDPHSDKALLEKYQKLSKKLWKGRVHWHESIDEDDKRAILEDTDILLSPSLHEGFGVPLIEALRYGCSLVHSDGGSQPEVSGGLGMQFPVRDVPAFVQCLDKAANARRRGMYACSACAKELTAKEWRERVQKHVDFYSYENFKEVLCSKMFADIPQKYGNLHELLAERRVATLNKMGLTTRPMPPIPQFMLDAVNEALAPLIPAAQGSAAVQGPVAPHVPVLCVQPVTAAQYDPHLQSAINLAHMAETEVQNIYNSLSWKITAPMRALASLADAVKVAFGRKDPVRERAASQWHSMASSATTPYDWQCIAQSRRSIVLDLHKSLSWKLSAPARCLYKQASKSNALRKIYAKVTGKPYAPCK